MENRAVETGDVDGHCIAYRKGVKYLYTIRWIYYINVFT